MKTITGWGMAYRTAAYRLKLLKIAAKERKALTPNIPLLARLAALNSVN